MAGKSVAKKGDVTATKGSKMYGGADDGSWTAGPVSETPYSNLKTDGSQVVYEATCKFSFKGTKTVGNSKVNVLGTSDVKLSAETKLLQKGQSKVLVDGNEKKDSYENKLSVSASNKLKTG